jgi:hypothetical protein
MDHFTRRPGGWQIATHAWRSTAAAFQAMPLLFLSAMVLAAALTVAPFYVPNLINLMMVAPKTIAPDQVWPALGLRTAASLVWALLAAPVAVAIHRFILLGRVTHGPVSWLPRYTLAFAAWLAFLRLLFALIRAPVLLMHDTGAEMMVIACISFAMLVVGVFLAMLFPAVAVEAPAKSLSARLETSMEQMGGHFWLLVWSGILALLPLMVPAIALSATLLVGFSRNAVAGLVTARPPVSVMVTLGLLAALQIVTTAVAAAAVSWLYSWISRPTSSDAASG